MLASPLKSRSSSGPRNHSTHLGAGVPLSCRWGIKLFFELPKVKSGSNSSPTKRPSKDQLLFTEVPTECEVQGQGWECLVLLLSYCSLSLHKLVVSFGYCTSILPPQSRRSLPGTRPWTEVDSGKWCHPGKPKTARTAFPTCLCSSGFRKSGGMEFRTKEPPHPLPLLPSIESGSWRNPKDM